MNILKSLLLCAAVASSAVHAEEKTLRVYNWFDYITPKALDDFKAANPAIKLIYDDTRSITEPSGALAVAGMRRFVGQRGVQGRTLVAVNSGANINFDSLRYVADRVGAQLAV